MTNRLILASSFLRVFSKLYQGKFEEGWEAGEELLQNFNDIDTLIRNYRPDRASPTERGWIFWREAIIRALEDVVGKLEIGSDVNAIAESIISYTDQWHPGDNEPPPDRSALEHPAKCPIYLDVRNSLLGWLKSDFSIELSSIEKSTLLVRFDRAIEDSVCRLWNKESPYFGQMIDQLSGPVAEGIGQRRQWDAHALWMRDRFWRDPLWGEEKTGITLSDLYIPLRGYSITEDKTHQIEKFGSEKIYAARVFDLHSEVERWLTTPIASSRNRIRVIGGSPGSGKSSFARKLGADVSRWDDWRVIFVEVQGMINTNDLHREIGHRLIRRRKETGFELNPLDLDEDRENMLLILDGLDELSKPGPEATSILTSFIRGLKEILSDKSSLRAIVLGRPHSAESALKETGQPLDHLLNVLWLAKVDHKRVKVSARNYSDPEKLGDIDQRDTYWEKWCKVTDNSPNTCLLKSEKFGELNVEPVLAFLVLKFISDGGDPAQIRNRNDIYDRVIRNIKPRGWGSAEHPGSEDLGDEDFIFLLECLGLAAWANGGRIGENAEFDRVRDHCALNQDYYRNIDAATLQNIATQFYTHIQGGYEFIHKSFAEYLTARGLITFIKQRLPSERKILEAWLELTGKQELDDQIFGFLCDEAKLCEPEEALELKKLLEKLFRLSQQQGFPAHEIAGKTWRFAEARQRNAEIANLACLSAFVKRVMETDPEAAMWSFDFPHKTSFMEMIDRITLNRESLATDCLDGVSLKGQALINANLICSSFFHAELSDVNLFGARVYDSNFCGVNLSDAFLMNIFSTRSNFDYANLSHADLEEAALRDATFKNSVLAYANFERADLFHVDFSNADLFEANFEDADLSYANLSDTINLTQEQINEAKGNSETLLPKELEHPIHWPADVPPIEKMGIGNRVGSFQKL